VHFFGKRIPVIKGYHTLDGYSGDLLLNPRSPIATYFHHEHLWNKTKYICPSYQYIPESIVDERYPYHREGMDGYHMQDQRVELQDSTEECLGRCCTSLPDMPARDI